MKRGKTVLQHVRKTRFYSNNANVATVDKYGKVMGVGEGTCTIYAIANNGVRSSVKVTVKSAPVSRHWGMFPDGQPTVGLYHG